MLSYGWTASLLTFCIINETYCSILDSLEAVHCIAFSFKKKKMKIQESQLSRKFCWRSIKDDTSHDWITHNTLYDEAFIKIKYYLIKSACGDKVSTINF